MIDRSFGTHDGSFHADEVTACAILLLFNLIDRDKIIRTRDSEKLSRCEYVCDVEGIYNAESKRFDHHQSDYKGDLSSAGMVWYYLKQRYLIDEITYEFVNRSLLLGVDAHDNGKAHLEPGVCTFSNVISNFVPIVYDCNSEEQNRAFFQALEFAMGHLKRLLERFHYIQSCKEMVVESMAQQKKVLVFETAIPWMESFFDLGGERHPALFVIMPSSGHWKLRGIPPSSLDRMNVRLPLPEEWAGIRDGDLKKVCGIEGAIFCHKGRFVSVWETKEDAFKALNYILKRYEYN